MSRSAPMVVTMQHMQSAPKIVLVVFCYEFDELECSSSSDYYSRMFPSVFSSWSVCIIIDINLSVIV